MTKDLNKNIIDIQYNCLNSPSKVTFKDGSTITYMYAVNGTKLRTVHTIGNTTTTTDYCGNVIYENGVQKLLLTDAGHVTLSDKKYHYYLQDHQGNNRVVVDQTGQKEEVNHYYPFGGTFASAEKSIQPYKYNGKMCIRDRLHTVYLWGYGDRYLIAEIKNATLEQVETAVSSVFGMTSSALAKSTTPDVAKLKALRNHTSLSEAHVTTFTHLPLVGVTSVSYTHLLSTTETYRDVIPSRICGNHISGFVSIMRGCNNFCTYCIVPYTRGRERSRDVESILNEVADLVAKGYKEVTLLGQNVNSYRFERPTGEVVTFPMLLRTVAEAAPGVRIRFTTSHPKDMSDETLEVIAQVPNVCKHIHLPVQSGSSRILKLMNRKYTRCLLYTSENTIILVLNRIL